MNGRHGKRFELQENWDGSWNYQFIADNGEPVGEESYSSKAAAMTGIDAWRGCGDAPVVVLPKQDAPQETNDTNLTIEE